MSVEDRKNGYTDLLANIRRLTTFVLDELEQETRLKLLDPAEKRMLTSAAIRLMRLWNMVMREGESKSAVVELNEITTLFPQTSRTDTENRGG